MPQASPHLSDGRYQLVEVLGSGGMAVVYRGHDARLQVDRAIKLLNPAMMAHPRMRERFLAEARTMARLHHPNLMAVHDVGDEQGRIFIVMDLVEGGTLWDWVEQHGPMPPRMAVEVMIKVLDGIEAAHDEGVIHRDIKPQNVLVTPRGRPMLTDFGIARVQDSGFQSLTRTGAAMGTLGFMAPEQRKHAKGVDERADIFALGSTLYALVTAELPVDIYASEVEAEMRVRLHPELVPIVRKSTRYLAEGRFQDVSAMRDALKMALPALPEVSEDIPALGGRRPRSRAPELNVPPAETSDDSGTMDIFVSDSDYMSHGSQPEQSASVAGASGLSQAPGARPLPSSTPTTFEGGPGGTILPTDTVGGSGGRPPAASPRRWLLPLVSVGLGVAVAGGLLWLGRGPAEPAPVSSPTDHPVSPPAVTPEPVQPEPSVVEAGPTEPPAASGEPVEESAPPPAAPTPSRPAPSPQPIAVPEPVVQAVEVDFPKVQVRINAVPWASWTLSGDATDRGNSTPFIGRLDAPGTYHFTLEAEDGRTHIQTVTLDGSRERLSECYSFVKDGSC